MLRLCIAGILFILICGCSNEDEVVTSSNIGTFHHIESFSSDYVENRPIDIWLPHGYEKNTDQQYPVMYLHDGQFMFDQPTSPFNKGVLMKFYKLYAKLRYGTGFFWT